MRDLKKRGIKKELPIGGESGIRTHGTLVRHTRFPSELLKPLGHLSGFKLFSQHNDFIF